ncbi:MAG: GNAT family N-acetyltransferase [Hydrogenophaga sp.]|uniref:GNAT family N-acetyltransferase n=1 Tax=Hydrogenophaga sp. TaxID=1904254 RepID=UPI00275EFF97|nr:GNAT family N-acetyltransferase [Hydrogenophaga sp.]MDP2417730.1 GNAT family N-acetyltransferase [Hydrogenophaga sp.]MDZ4189905.1 GNAT family N-acetyltransferase [Hydrogenophaga sp.]
MPSAIRPLQAADLPAVAQLFDQYRQFYQQASNLEAARRFMTERFERQESVVLVAQAPTGALVGFCQMYPSFCSVEAAPIYTLYDLFVSPAAREVGTGRQLMLAGQARAAADGMVRMDLTTARTNLKAQSLYTSLGWVRDDVFLTFNRLLIDADRL